MKYIWAILGFLLFIIGTVSLILNSMGLELSFMIGINSLPPLWMFVTHLIMIFGGVVIMYLTLVDWRKDETHIVD